MTEAISFHSILNGIDGNITIYSAFNIEIINVMLFYYTFVINLNNIKYCFTLPAMFNCTYFV